MNILGKNLTKILYNGIYKYEQLNYRGIATFKSDISLENLYPNSSLKITTPEKLPNYADEKFNGFIPIDELEITYSKSSGPGGQNVNKVNTKVDLRFHLESAKWLDNNIKNKLAEKYKTKISKDGYMIFRSDLTRSQQLNLADCLEKIRTTVRNCLAEETIQSPETEEKLRRRHEKAIRERLALKRNRSQVKNDRQTPSAHEIL